MSLAVTALTTSASRRTARSSGLLRTIEQRTGLTAAGLSVIACAATGWLLGHALGGRTIFLLAYCMIALLGGSFYAARRKRPVRAQRSEVVRRAREGQILEVSLTLSADRPVTTFVMEEGMDPLLGGSVRLPVSAVRPGEDVEHRYTITPRLRGVYRVGKLTAEFSDPLGLVKWKQVLADDVEIVVHPRTEVVLDRPLTRAFEEPEMRPPNARAWPEGFSFYGMRDYVPGDDFRRVVWRAFARTEKLMVREFEQGISDRVSIVVDTDRMWHSPGRPSDTFETAVRVAASVGSRFIHDGLSVRLEANYAPLGAIFRGPRSRLPFLDETARVHLSREPLHAAVERLVGRGRRDAHVLIVTSHLDARSAAAANMLVSGGGSLTVAALVWEESDSSTAARAREIGAQVVQVKPGAALARVFSASLSTNLRARI